jgi:hypothetical protein
MLEGILIFLTVTSYISIAQLVAVRVANKGEAPIYFLFYILLGWLILPIWFTYKLWEYLLYYMPDQISWWWRNRK